MFQFVPNYVHVVSEKIVPCSLYATENKVETLHRPKIFLKDSIHCCVKNESALIVIDK
jgi:hypothetical protein